ncbi:helix-turn-helix domain-containing protein [Paenibacillus kribbensis]|uniref:helix-turn-helix domain-containing protein n=1 Tax=Paenibacillus kribbensis TaxID=172713 RepID=UPI002119804F|nr:helix-turn-helix domain-containing protein [Paenibacillus kribbensis]
MKRVAIRLHLEEGWTYRRIMEHLGIPDRHRLKVWMKKYKLQGEFGLMDKRGNREEYIDQDRYMHAVETRKQLLKKCLQIWMQEVCSSNTKSSRKPRKSTT